MIILDIMNTNIKTASPEDTLREVAMVLVMSHISGLPVVDTDYNVIGLISEKDILIKMFPDLDEVMSDRHIGFENLENKYANVLNMKVKDVMTKEVFSVETTEPCLKAASQMWLKKVRRVPVTTNGKLVGIVSIGDVHREIFKRTITQ